MLFSTYRYNIAFWPEVLVREVAGRLVRNKSKSPFLVVVQ